MVNKITSPITPLGEIDKINEVIDQVNTNTTDITGKQATLVSGTNIKTINNTSLLGSGNIDIQGGGSGSSRQIGEIVTSTIPLTDAGLHLLDGALISGSGSYGDFVTYISGLVSTYPNLFTTESGWQDTVTQYGVCGKFVYDSVANTVRLPKYSNKIYTQELDATAPVVGNGMSLGLTNGDVYCGLSHNTASPYHLGGAPTGYGAQIGQNCPTTNALGSQKSVGVTTNASYSGIIAQLSNITTSLDGYYYIVVATTTKTEIEVDIDEIATDLNGKADTDLLNVPESRGILVEKSSKDILPRWYRVYSDGWCEQGGVNTVSSTSVVASLLKNYINNNYSVITQGYRNTYNTNNTTNIQILSKSNSQINMACATTTLSIEWQACGYIR